MIVYVLVSNTDELSMLYKSAIYVPLNIIWGTTVYLFYYKDTLEYHGFSYDTLPDQEIDSQYKKIPLSELVALNRERKLIRIL